LLAAVTQDRDGHWKVFGGWAIALRSAGGVGMAWPHLSAWLMRTVDALEAKLRLQWHSLFCWNCKRYPNGTFTLCTKAGEAWLDAIQFRIELEQ
jgi:hypothetical protein